MVGPLQIENEAFNLARFYLQRMRQHTPRVANLKLIKKSRVWPQFLAIVEMHGGKPEWDAAKFVNFVFDEFGPVYPAQMKTQEVWNEFTGKFSPRDQDEQKQMALELLNSYKVIKKWCDKHNEFLDIEKYLEMTKNRIYVKRGGLSPYFIAVSKTLTSFVESLPEKDRNAIIKGDLENKRRYVHKFRKLRNKMQEVLGNEFI